MKILVTGAAGFLGTNLLLALSHADEANTVLGVVRCLPKNPCTSVYYLLADLSSPSWTTQLPDENFDVVIHLAQSRFYRDFPSKAIDIFNINVRATVELAEWSMKHGVQRFLFASTGNVYGQGQVVHREEDACHPDTMYGATKLSAEILLKPFSAYMTILPLRIFGVYGPGQVNAMLPNVMQRFNAGDEITLASNVGVKFNPIFVKDCISAIRRLISLPIPSRFEVLNIGGPEPLDLKYVAELLESFSGRKALTRTTPDPSLQLLGSNEKFFQLCGSSGYTRFDDGLRKTFDFFNKTY